MRRSLKSIYKGIIEDKKGEIQDWHDDYIEFYNQVEEMRNRLVGDNNLDSIKDEMFLRRLMYDMRNGIASRGQSVLSNENFMKFVADNDFIEGLTRFIKNPDKNEFEKFETVWEDAATKYGANKNPVLVNRVAAACTLDVSTTVDFGKFNQVFSWLVREKIIPAYPAEEDQGWFSKNCHLMKELKIAFKDELRDKKTDEFYLSQFVWGLYENLSDTYMRNLSDLVKTGNKAVILYGPPGTGKTYEAKRIAKKFMEVSKQEADAEGYSEKDPLNKYWFSDADIDSGSLETGRVALVQFHPGYTYEQFIGGIQPDVNGGQISYKLVPGIFKRFCDCARANQNQKFVFIIDEINRADLSAVFGELLYALEYREEEINLPHFGKFSIPDNIYLIGTMNDVDKSLSTLDVALRRRFGFFELMPKLETLLDMEAVADKNYDNLEEYIQRCKELNENISKKLNLSKNHQIGQAYFKKITDFCSNPSNQPSESENKIKEHTIDCFGLEKLWIYHIGPLLEEYLGTMGDDEETKDQLKKLKTSFVNPLASEAK